MEEGFSTVQTKQGLLRGKFKQSIFSEKTYCTFQGIPYAKPPVGKLRFKAPEPLGGWEGVRDALKDGHDCTQMMSAWARPPELGISKVTTGDENCLFINVSTNKLPSAECPNLARPVMVFIHGGGFAGGSGSAELLGPDFFMEEDVVLVTFNYRCGPLGFLSLESEELPGNAGLKDQTLALRWVQDNVHCFGGDPNNVTIFGISAGGASVQYHLISPLSKGLFHKAIIQSGSCLNPWALQQHPKSNATLLAQTLGCHSQDPHEILRFLQEVPADNLIIAQKKLIEEKEFDSPLLLVFTPCVELDGGEAFLPDFPERLMEAGEFLKVPVMLGVVINEGSVFLGGGQCVGSLVKEINENLAKFIASSLAADWDQERENEISNGVKDFYMDGKAVSSDNLGKIINFLGDVTVIIGMERSRRLLLKHCSSPVYSYLFSNHARCLCHVLQAALPAPLPEHVTKLLTGSCHGGDALYLFAPNAGKIKTPEITKEDRIAISRHVRAWTSFALKGNPNYEDSSEEWKEDSERGPCFMELGKDWLLRRGVPFEERISFWGKLLKYDAEK